MKHTTIRESGTLTAGSRGLPWDPALEGIALRVTSRKSGTTIGGVAVPESNNATTVVARVIDGAVKLHLAKGAKVAVTGWYGTPAAAPGGRTNG